MKKSRFTESQIVAVLKEGDAGVPVAQLVRKHGISTATYYTWRSKYAGVGVSEARRLRELEPENAKLEKEHDPGEPVPRAQRPLLLELHPDLRCTATQPSPVPWPSRGQSVTPPLAHPAVARQIRTHPPMRGRGNSITNRSLRRKASSIADLLLVLSIARPPNASIRCSR